MSLKVSSVSQTSEKLARSRVVCDSDDLFDVRPIQRDRLTYVEKDLIGLKLSCKAIKPQTSWYWFTRVAGIGASDKPMKNDDKPAIQAPSSRSSSTDDGAYDCPLGVRFRADYSLGL